MFVLIIIILTNHIIKIGEYKMEDKRIRKLKRQAEKHYLVYHKIANDYSFGLFSPGATLSEYISPGMVHHKTEFNRIMDELAEIDPLTPNFRL